MNTDRDPANYQFSFAVIADTHINHHELACNSPFEVNKLANRRLKYVVRDLNQRDLRAVFHLGDVVHPVPSMGELYTRSAQHFFNAMRHLRHPLHIIPGNHDVGDKPIDWGPAGTVRDSFLQVWTAHFGEHYFHVRYGDLEFIGINVQLLGSGLDLETQQRQWLEALLQSLAGRRLVLLSHYPPFLDDPAEPEHYDNLGIAGRRWMLDLISRYRVEALFCGHVHQFWYHRYAACDCYLLPSTAFTRQDYSEMFRVGPDEDSEFGRNDLAKLGYFIIHVYDNGHDFELVRCYGTQQETVSSALKSAPSPSLLSPVNARSNRAPVLGFDLRYDWAERVQIPPSGALDEFNRKWVRNDYPLLALWEMGVKYLRIPLLDLLDANKQQRIRDLHHLGFVFSSYAFGIPDANSLSALTNLKQAVVGLEIVQPLTTVGALDLSALAAVHDAEIPIYLSPLRSKKDLLEAGEKYYHVINHGLMMADIRVVDRPPILPDFSSDWAGYVFRVSIKEPMLETIKRIKAFDGRYSTKSLVHLRLADDNPAVAVDDYEWVYHRLAQAMFCTWALDGPMLYCDTLADIDRGYFPRLGVVDRLCNPQLGFHVIRNLHATLSEMNLPKPASTVMERDDGTIQATTEHNSICLVQTSLLPSSAELMVDLISGEKYTSSSAVPSRSVGIYISVE